MTFKLTIESENAAFTGDQSAHEVGRILRSIANKIENGRDGGKVMDINGNAVGTWDYCPSEEEEQQ